MAIVDYFAFAGTFPFGAPGSLSIDKLLKEMDADGIDRGYVTEMGAAFLKEPTSANIGFVDRCSSHADRLHPLPIIDLGLDTFEDDLRRYHEDFDVKGIRIAPNCHGYAISEALAGRLLAALSELDLMLFVARELEDTRFQSECLGVTPLDFAGLAPLLEAESDVRIVLNNFGAAEIRGSSALGRANVYFDVAAFDKSFCAMEGLVEEHGPAQLVFGSHVPFLYRGAVLHNLRNSLLGEDDIQDILRGGIE